MQCVDDVLQLLDRWRELVDLVLTLVQMRLRSVQLAQVLEILAFVLLVNSVLTQACLSPLLVFLLFQILNFITYLRVLLDELLFAPSLFWKEKCLSTTREGLGFRV